MCSNCENCKYDNEAITVKKAMEEFNIGKEKALKIFRDKDLPVQTYTRPQFVLRKHLLKYFGVRHDDL